MIIPIIPNDGIIIMVRVGQSIVKGVIAISNKIIFKKEIIYTVFIDPIHVNANPIMFNFVNRERIISTCSKNPYPIRIIAYSVSHNGIIVTIF